ncbi:Arm DNA-binding domain-containing protein [Pseudorhodobacter sp. W20_MBD10_FR17]|uniref:Arm DNA-binding domain-containing protein n=1 Tax=Pseudorhodobacter sp. W20_MBD10_FR17 TaxID=3240266 RepID=UPI003F950DC7
MGRGSELLTMMKTKGEAVFYLDGKTLTEPGHYRDGKGLYLQVSVWGTKSWVFRYTAQGKARGMGLGSVEDVSLKDARYEVERLRVVVREGRDPVEERRALNAVPDVPKVVTRCSPFFLTFIRAAGIVKTFDRKSISPHVAPRTSPLRLAQ